MYKLQEATSKEHKLVQCHTIVCQLEQYSFACPFLEYISSPPVRSQTHNKIQGYFVAPILCYLRLVCEITTLVFLIQIKVAAEEIQIRVQHELIQVNLHRHLPRRSHDRAHRPCRGPIRRTNDRRRVAIPGEEVLAVARRRLIIYCFRLC